MTYPVIECNYDVFVYACKMTMFNFIFLFWKRSSLDSFFLSSSPPIILMGLNVLSGFYVFILDFSIERIYFYVIPIIGPVLFLKDIFGWLGIFLAMPITTCCPSNISNVSYGDSCLSVLEVSHIYSEFKMCDVAL